LRLNLLFENIEFDPNLEDEEEELGDMEALEKTKERTKFGGRYVQPPNPNI